MVYRLVPSYKFTPTSHFGGSDLVKPKLLKGMAYGLLVAVLVLAGLYLMAMSKENVSLARYADLQDGLKKLNMRRFGLELVLPIGLGCAVVGAYLGHCYLSDDE